MNKGVWVFIEQSRMELKEASLMLVGEGRKLADKLKQDLSAVVMGNDIEHFVERIGQCGADKVFAVQDAHLADYNESAYTSALTNLLKEHKPSTLLFTATSIGRDLAPRVAAALGTGLVTNCDAVELNDKRQLVMTKPVYGGKLSQKTVCPKARPQMVTYLPNALEVPEVDESRAAEVIKIDAQIDPELLHTEVKGFIKGDPRTIDITDAERIVCAGGGLGDPENLPIVEELANELGAAVAASRVAVDKSWLPFQRQIGQTGKTVVPKLIMTFGVSGQIQFTMGMKDSKLIVSNNKDKEAPIFKIADVGIVGDLKEVIPALAEKLREVKQEEAD